MLAVASNTIFYSFKRAGAEAKPDNARPNGKQKISPLPFSIDKFTAQCDPLIPRPKGIPQTTGKCAPAFYPYVVEKGDQDQIANLVGHHRYVNGDPKYYQDYDDPVAHGLHPVYMVLPPLKNVTLVRVEDREGNADQRDMFSGAYLSIKDGKVVDQLNEGCTFLPDYSCVDDRGTKQYRLLESGKFAKY
jgi:hypothetical protein